MGRHIVLIGFMGSGKTTLGIRLSYRLRRPFLDTDSLIEKKTGMSVKDIFREKGEGFFRDLETGVLEELCKEKKEYIISTGGGMPLREQNRKLMKKMGKVFYLQITAQQAVLRLKGDKNRPLLQGDEQEVMKKIKELMEKREEYYLLAADTVIEEKNLSQAEVLDKLVISAK